MNIRRRSFNAALLGPMASALGLAGQAMPAQAQMPQRGVVISISLEPNSLDPTTSPSASIGELVHYNVFEGLTKIEESGAVSPLLAESWMPSADGLSLTFKLRQGVFFHDGAAFDASAVKFSFDRSRAANATNKAKKTLFDNMLDINTPDALTVVLSFKRADANVLFRLGENTAVILHPNTAAQAATHPVGTGPYQFVQWKKGWGVHLVKFEGFRQARQIHIPQVTFRFINSQQEQAAAVMSGEVDMLFNSTSVNVNKFRANSSYQVLVGSASGKGMLAINNRRKPLDDVRVRRAIAHAIDREGYIKSALDDGAKAIGSHFAPTEPGYINLTGVYSYNPERAKALLKEAGVTTPLALRLALPPTPYARTDKVFLADALAKVGIQVKVEELTWAQWLEGPFKGNFDLTVINHVEPLDYAIYTDPTYYFGYDSQPFRDLVARHAASSNARERQILIADIQRHLAVDAVNAWIFASQITAVSRKGLKGWWMNYPVFAHDIGALRWE